MSQNRFCRCSTIFGIFWQISQIITNWFLAFRSPSVPGFGGSSEKCWMWMWIIRIISLWGAIPKFVIIATNIFWGCSLVKQILITLLSYTFIHLTIGVVVRSGGGPLKKLDPGLDGALVCPDHSSASWLFPSGSHSVSETPSVQPVSVPALCAAESI